MRVLWVIKGLRLGGAEQLLISLAGAMDRDRFEVELVYVVPDSPECRPLLERAGVRVTLLEGFPRPSWVGRFRAFVADNDIDVVHFHSPLVAAAGRLAVRTLPVGRRPAVVTTEHNLWASLHPLTRLANAATTGLNDAVIAVSGAVKESMGLRRQRAEIAVQGLDVSGLRGRAVSREQARAALGVEDDELVVVSVAGLRKAKDHLTLLEAAALLVARGRPVRFFCVGKGELARPLEERRDELGLGDAFRFLGFHPEPVRMLSGADVFCLSSRFEGLPIALLEAMAVGCPAVVTNVGGMPEVVREGREGHLVPAGDPGALADAIEALLDPVVRSAMATAAARRAEDYDIRNAATHLEGVYERVTGPRATSTGAR